MERNIRRWKREYNALSKNGQDATEAAVKLKSWREQEADFLRQTKLPYQGSREQVVGFGRSEAAKATWAHKKEVEKYTKFHYNKDGTIVVTDDWKDKKKPTIPREYKPFAVIETKTTYKNGDSQIDRSFYGENGILSTQVHSGPHNRPDQHKFGRKGEHGHTYSWNDDGSMNDRSSRELTETERIENADILGGEADER